MHLRPGMRRIRSSGASSRRGTRREIIPLGAFAGAKRETINPAVREAVKKYGNPEIHDDSVGVPLGSSHCPRSTGDL